MILEAAGSLACGVDVEAFNGAGRRPFTFVAGSLVNIGGNVLR